MKTSLIMRVFPLLFFVMFSLEGNAQSKKLIHFWDFNNTVPTSGIGDVGANHDSLGNSAHPLPVQYTSLPLSGAKIVYTRPHAIQPGATRTDSVLDNVTLGAFYYDFSSVHYPYFTSSDSSVSAAACGCSGNLSVRTRNPSINSYMYMYVPTTGYMNVQLLYDITASNNKGAQYNIFSYSTDGGTTWNNLTQAMDTFNIAGVKRPDTLLALNSVTVSHTWYPVNIDFSTAGTVNNNGNFIIRFYLTGSNSIGTTGFNAYDNIAIRGDSVCPVLWYQPKNSTICSGSNTYFVTHVSGGLNNTYQWQENTGSGFANVSNGGVYSGATSDSLVLTNVPVGMNGYQYRCVIICAPCNNDTTTTAVLTVNALPAVTANTTLNPVCLGGSVTLTGGGATTYTWTGGVTNGVPFSPAATQTYTVTGTTAAGCKDTASITLVVTPAAVIKITPPSATICSGGTGVSLTASNAVTYTWSPPTGLSSTNTATVTANPAGSTTYTVTGNVPGCTSGTQTVAITVSTTPTVTVTPSSASICSGGTGTSLTATGAASYSWSPAGGLTCTNCGNPTANPVSTTTYTVTGTTATCISTPKTVVITLNTTPTVSVSTAPTTICSGNSSTLTASGSTTYLWSTGATTSSITVSPVTTTTYTVTGTSAGCSSTPQTVTVTVNPTPTVTVVAAPATICSGSSSTLTANGAATYSWSTGATTSAITVSPATTTTYTVTGTSTGCVSAPKTITVIVNPTPTVTATAAPATICSGSSSTLTASGAVTYSWNTGATTSAITVSPGTTTTYTVTGISTGCASAPQTVTVTVTPTPTITASAAPTAICSGSSSTLTASGATTYSWSTGATTSAITVSPGTTTTYTVTGTTTGCSGTANITVTVHLLPTVTANATANPVCVGSNVTLTGGGATSYTWSGGVTNGVAFTPATTQTYTVTGTDVNGCVNTANITITVNTLPTVTANASANPVCAGSNVTLSGGGASTYTWSGGVINGLAFVPAATQTYTVTGTDVNGCVNTASTTITVNPLPVVTANASANPICAGSNVTLTGGGASSYTWSSGVTNGVAFTPASTQTYTVTGTDVNGCVNTANITVTVHPLPTVTASTSSNPVCAGSNVTLTGGGASSYTWSGGVTNGISFTPASTQTYTVTGTDVNGCVNTANITVTVNALPTVTANTTLDTVCSGGSVTLTGGGAKTYVWTGGVTNGVAFTPASTQTYTVTGTDANGCINTANVTVTVKSLPAVTANASVDSVCTGGSVILTGGGATSYTWSGGVTNGVAFIPASTQTYTVTGTGGSSGCSSTASITITVNTLPTVKANSTSAAVCIGSSITLTGSGATTYVWSSGVTNGVAFIPGSTQTYTVTGTNSHGCSNTDSVKITVNPLPTVTANTTLDSVCMGGNVTLTGGGAQTYVWTGGVTNGVAFSPASTQTYTVTGTDVNGCVNTANTTVTVNPLPAITATSTMDSVCAGGSITLTGGGATSYSWSGGVTNGVAFIPASTQTYMVTGTDTHGCSNTANIKITVDPIPTITVTPASPSICFGGNTVLTASGANKYSWSPSTSLSCTNCPNPTASPTVTTKYTVVGTSVSGCIDSTSVTITVAAKVTATISGNDTVCAGTSTSLTASGGGTYLWNTGATTPTVNVTPLSNTTYSVKVTSAGCSDSTQVVVVVNSTPTVTITGTNSICLGASTTLNASGGTSYIWSTSATTTSITVTPATTTTYSVTASNGLCTKDTSMVVTVSSLAGVSISGPQTVCAGSPVTITASGGTSYLWSTGATATSSSITVTPISTTTYSVTVTNGACVKDTTSTITVNPLPAPSITGNNIICSGDSTTLTANGGISYTWNTGATTTSVTVHPSTTTTYTLQASNGLCTHDTTMVVIVNSIPVPTITGSQSICLGATANLTASGGSTYKWSTGSISSTIIVSPTTNTTYTVTAANGTCTAKDSVTVVVNPLPVEAASPNTTITITQSTPLSVSPQTSGNTYSWSPSASLSCADCPDPVASPTVTTTYYVITTSSDGCSTEDTVEVIVNDNCGHLFIPNGFSPNKDGHNDQFMVYGFCIKTMDFVVFDRWGNKIFESTSQKDGWDGTYKGQPMNSDTYAYEFEATLIDGTKIHKSGNVALIR